MVSETPTSYLTLQTFLSFQNPSLPSYLFRDTDANPQCDLPLTSSNYYFEYWFYYTAAGTTKTYPNPVVSDCTGQTYSTSSITYTNGGSTSGTITTDDTTVSLNFGSSYLNNGDRPYYLQVNYKSGLKPLAIKVCFPPPPPNVGTPESPNHDIDSCNEQIYPLQYGFSFNHYVNSMDLDPYGNLLLTGYSNQAPFSFDNEQKGFVQLIDQRGKQYWTQAFSYSLDSANQNTICNQAKYQSGGYIYAACSIGSEYFMKSLKFLHMVKLYYLSGKIIHVKKLPNDIAPTSQEMYLLQDIGTNKILASYSAQKNGYYGFVNLVFDDTSNTINYYKFYNYLNRVASYQTQILINIATDSFWVIRQEQSYKVVVLQGKLSDGTVTSALTLSDVVNTGSKRAMIGTLSSSGLQLLIPALDASSNILFIYLVDVSTLSVLQTIKIIFPAAYTPSSSSVDFDENQNIYLAVGGKHIYWAQFTVNTATDLYQRVWTGSGQSSFAAYISGAKYYQCNTTTKCSSSSYFTFFQSQISTTNFPNQGVFIFKSSSNENCYDVRDIDPSNSTWYPTITSITSASAITTFSDISQNFGSNTDNYPMIYDAYIQQTINSQSTETWGVVEITDIKEYKKYPLSQFYCGSIARQKSFQTNDGVGTIVDVVSSGSSTPTMVAVNASFTNCQGKQLAAVLWDSMSNNQSIAAPKSNTYTFNNATSVKVSNTDTYYNQMAFKVRYYDNTYGNSIYFYDHSLLIRYISATNISSSKYDNISNCAQTPFPLGLGGEKNGLSGLYPNNIVADQTDLSVYITGIGEQDSAYFDSNEQNNAEAIVMRVSQTGRVVWLNNINSNSYSGNQEEAGAMTLTSNYVYVGIYVYQGTFTWVNNYNTLVKLTKNEGKLDWVKKVVPRNIMGSYYLSFNMYFDLVTNPRNESLIMASVKYYCCSGNGQLAGNFMIYDNGVDITTLYDYQYQPFNQQTISSAGQIAFDLDTDNAYISSTLSLSSVSYQDILVLKLDTLTGAQIWNRWLNVTIASYSGILQPIVLVNNFTKFIYVATQINTNNLQIARLNNGGALDMHQILKTSPNSYYQLDMTTDNRNGNLILVGSSQSSVQEIIFLSSNLAYLRGNFRIHTSDNSGRHRMIAKVDNFFYTQQRNVGFSWNYGKIQMILGKKSLNPFETYKYECHIYSEVTGQFSMIQNLSLSSISAPNNVIFFSSQTLFFMPDYCRVRNDQPYFNVTYLRPDIMDGYRMTGTKSATTCSSIGGGRQGPPGDLAIALEVVKGSTARINFSSDMFFMQNCQGDQMSLYSSSFLDEMQSSSTGYSNSFITMQKSSSPYYIQIDATGASPQPGVRWMTALLQVNGVQSPVLMPVYVYPTVTPNAVIQEPDPICSESDQKYPKLISRYSNVLNDADIDQDNGNFLVCGYLQTAIMQTIEYRYGSTNSFIALFDQNGQLYWGYSGVALYENSQAASCKFASGQSGIYQLIALETSKLLLLSKMDYITGKILYIRRIQGDFNFDITTTFMKIDSQYNQAYITSTRTDITNSSFYINGYVAKADLNPDYPIQQYYSYMHWLPQDSSEYSISSLQVLHSQDYLVTMGKMNYSNTYYAAIVLSSKTTGKFIASTYFQSITSNPSLQMYHDLVADDQYIYYAFSSQAPKSIRIVKLQIPSLSNVKSNGHSLTIIDGQLYSVISLANDTNYIYALSKEPNYQNQYLTKFLKSDLSIIATVFWNERKAQTTLSQRMIIYGSYLFTFYTNLVLQYNYQTGIINQFTLTLQSPYTCNEVVPFTPTQYYSVTSFNPSGVVDFYVEVGEYKYKTWQKYYFEYWVNSNVYFMYDTKFQSNCSFKEPKFTTELEDQVVQLPIGSAQTYTFDWPIDCFSSALTFTWSVDTYTQSNKPAFLSFTSTSTQSTLQMNPTTSDIGTYVVRVRFEITSNPVFYTEKTFVVEVYPEINYGQKSVMCPSSSIYLAFFYLDSIPTTQWNRMDMDSQGLNFIMCGWTKSTLLNKNPSYYAGFISSFTQGLNLNFHITIQFLQSASYCFTYYLNNTYTYSLFSYMTLQNSYPDAFSLYRHTSSGQYSKGRTYTTGQQVIVLDYNLDQTAGYSYVLAYLVGTKLNRGQKTEFLIFKLDKDLAYISGNAYGSDAINIYGRNFAITSSSIYVIFDWQNPSGYYSTALTSLSQTDGSFSWMKTPYVPSVPSTAYSYVTRNYPHQSGITYYQNYLYICFSYAYPSNSVEPFDVYFARINPATGALLQRVAWSTEQIQVDEINIQGLSSNLNQIAISLSKLTYNHISFINVTSSTSLSIGASYYIYDNGKSAYALSLFERSSILWSFTRFATQASYGDTYSFLTKLNTSTLNWDGICTQFQGSYQYMYSLPNGSGNDFISSWQDFPVANPIQQWAVPSKLYNRWYSNIMNTVMYPINNSSANTRYSSLCQSYAAPTAPTVVSRVGPYINSTSGGFNVNLLQSNMLLPAFDQCSGLLFSSSLTFANGSALTVGPLFTFNSTILNLVISAYSNAQIGIFQLKYTAKLNVDSSYTTSVNFQVQINSNNAPTPVMDFLSPVTIYAFKSKNWAVQFGADTEGDTPIFNVQLLNSANTSINSSQSLLFVNQSDDTGIIFSFMKAPNASSIQQYYLQVLVSDSFNTLSPNLYNISLKVQPNYPPYLNPSFNQTIPSIYITQSFSYTIWYQNFTDDESDIVSISCSVVPPSTSPNALWTSIQINQTIAGNISLSGQTPWDNAYSGKYIFSCLASDLWGGSNQYDFPLIVLPKPNIQILGSYQNYSILLPNNLTLLFTNSSIDPIGAQNYYFLYINNTIYNPTTQSAWLKWDNITRNITATPTMNQEGGNHSISIMYIDNISTPQYVNFTLEIIQNLPLKALAALSNKQAIAYNWFSFDYNASELFSNPEGVPFQMYFRLSQSGNSLPYFISKNFSNGTIGGFTTDVNVGSYLMECVGVDDSLLETVISFVLVVKPCYYKCQKCWDSLYNTCTACKTNYFLFNAECLDLCLDGTYEDFVEWSCFKCPLPCALCTGSDPLQNCSKCNPGYFYLKNGCYSQCPDGYYGDKSDYTCKQCHQACTLCYGASYTQCTNCTEIFATNEIGDNYKAGYLLQGTYCLVPKCLEGQYYLWSINPSSYISYGHCYSCNSRCKQCSGPLANQCISCHLGAILNTTSHTCTYCEEIAGYFTNEEYQCEDVCGDGIVLTKQCDDGNQISGDGCSRLCMLEQGFACKAPNKPCIETIPPTFKIITISNINQVFVQFSEPVTIKSPSDISPSNLLIEIDGSEKNYIFSWRIIIDQKNQMLPNRNIMKFSLILEDFKQSMDGSEVIKISFNDSSTITDLVGNQLTEGYFAQISANPFIYFSPEELKTSQSGGSSMKYAFFSVFSFNLILKLVLNSSMQYLWGLVHALQVFSFLLYINIDFPENVVLFTQYFQVASGNLDEINKYIPNLFDYLINEDNVIDVTDDIKLPQKFKDEDMSPYFIFAYGQKMTIWIFLFTLFLPLVLIMSKFCKKVKLWENIKSSFFFNSPLRGIVEQYIEIIMQIILNSQFIKFKNADSLIVTVIAFVCGACMILLPFLTMSLIYSNRKMVLKEEYKVSFGMLTEECERRSITQLYYYPLFLFQRLVITGIIVYLQSTPFLQCALVMLCNVLMTFYLVIVKPFKEENLQTTTVLDEIIIFICVGLFGILYLKNDMPQSQKKNIGWLIIACISFSICKNFSVVIYFGVIKTKRSFEKIFGGDDMQIDSPHSSDNEDMVQINKNFQEKQLDYDTDEMIEEVKQQMYKESQNTTLKNLTIKPVERSQQRRQFNLIVEEF